MIKEIKYNGYTAQPSDYACADGDLAGMAVFRDLGLVRQAQVQGRQTGRGVARDPPLHQRGRQNQAVHRAGGSATDTGAPRQLAAVS